MLRPHSCDEQECRGLPPSDWVLGLRPSLPLFPAAAGGLSLEGGQSTCSMPNSVSIIVVRFMLYHLDQPIVGVGRANASPLSCCRMPMANSTSWQRHAPLFPANHESPSGHRPLQRYRLPRRTPSSASLLPSCHATGQRGNRQWLRLLSRLVPATDVAKQGAHSSRSDHAAALATWQHPICSSAVSLAVQR